MCFTSDIFSYILFALVACITPGPNNFLLFAYGKSYGIKKTIPVMAGIFLGFFSMLILTGFGIGKLITENESVNQILKIVASAWFIYLAILLRNASMNQKDKSKPKVGFLKAFIMQYVNPKAWVMAIAGASLYLPDCSSLLLSVIYFATIFNLVGIPCMITWTLGGNQISRYLRTDRANQVFGYSMASLLIISVLMIWIF